MTTSPPQAPPVTPAGVVAAARESVAGLTQVVWAAREPTELLDTVTELERLRSVLAAVEAEVAVEVEATDAAKTIGWVSTPDYLTSVAGARKGAGKKLLRTGRAITSDREATWVALQAGDISPEHAEVIVRAVDRLPVDPEVRDRGEAFLIDQAEHLDATDLAKAAEHLLEVLDPDRAHAHDERALDRLERSAHLGRELVLTEDGLGGVRLRGRGTTEDAAVLKAALAALAAPTPTSAATGTGATNGTARAANGTAGAATGAAAGSAADGCEAGGRDPRDHGARCWDALVQVARTALDARVLPESHGIRPRVILTLAYDHLRAGLGTAVLDTGDTLSAAAVRKLACDAEVIPAVLGTRGEVLDVGRTQRLVTTALWTALVLRDRHCAFPGCRRPPIACDAHHIQHWANHGPTALHNLVLLCRAHHTHVHTTGWQIRINPTDQQPEFQPPLGRRRQPRRQHDPADDPADDRGGGDRAGGDRGGGGEDPGGGWIREPTPRE